MQYPKTNNNQPSISITPSSPDLSEAYRYIFSQGALNFLSELITTFQDRVSELHWNRLKRKCEFQLNGKLPSFSNSALKNDSLWKIKPIPHRIQDRRLDLGDVSPANKSHFIKALNANVQGIQVDFDDGHCPTWRNQIIGFYNVYQAIQGKLPGANDIYNIPILMLRPRAWNMTEHNIMINGKKAPGPLIDFGILMYHNSHILTQAKAGPFFYLSKLEGASEAKLWNDIFIWTQQRLGLPYGTIKACVLIENIYAAFEMEEILFELKDHSLGLNCGIWDYAASIICKFGDNPKFMLPDRNKYVNMQRHFLKKYMQLVIRTCHRRGAHATGGMAALLINENQNSKEVINKVIEAKRVEIIAGVDGFMVYDLELVPYMNQLWKTECGLNINQLNKTFNLELITEHDLLKMPIGGVTHNGLIHNIEVAVLFITNWLKGRGHFYHKNVVEDSATAEISRSQIWQWIRHGAIIEDSGKAVTKDLVQCITIQFVKKQKDNLIHIAAELFLEIVTMPYFPDFITTYLNDHIVFKIKRFKNTELNSKL